MLLTAAAQTKKLASFKISSFKDNPYNEELYDHLRSVFSDSFDKTFSVNHNKGTQRWLTSDVVRAMKKSNNWPTITHYQGLSLSTSQWAEKHLVNRDVNTLNIYLKNRFDAHPGVTSINTQPIWWCLKNDEHSPMSRASKPSKWDPTKEVETSPSSSNSHKRKLEAEAFPTLSEKLIKVNDFLKKHGESDMALLVMEAAFHLQQ